jgi:rubrerythrin
MMHEATVMKIETSFGFDRMDYEVIIKCFITQEQMASMRCGKVIIITDHEEHCPLCGAPL